MGQYFLWLQLSAEEVCQHISWKLREDLCAKPVNASEIVNTAYTQTQLLWKLFIVSQTFEKYQEGPRL